MRCSVVETDWVQNLLVFARGPRGEAMLVAVSGFQLKSPAHADRTKDQTRCHSDFQPSALFLPMAPNSWAAVLILLFFLPLWVSLRAFSVGPLHSLWGQLSVNGGSIISHGRITDS